MIPNTECLLWFAGGWIVGQVTGFVIVYLAYRWVKRRSMTRWF